jgi:hypothetical protein
MITEEDKEIILSEFPNVKLSYENIIHKKVYPLKNDYLMIVPHGNKCFVWFTLYKDKPVCLLFELDNKNNKKIKNIKIINCCFTNTLSYGTILYGTSFYHMNNKFFSIEDIFLYKGQDFSDYTYQTKLLKICSMLKNDIKQISYNNCFVVFGMPIISQSYEDLDKKIVDVKYKINSINYIDPNRKKSFLVLPFHQYNKKYDQPIITTTHNVISTQPTITSNKIYEQSNITAIKYNTIQNIQRQNIQRQNIQRQTKVFLCNPDIQNDIYHLYSLNNEYIGLACIPDYKTSIMMNNLFRIIKENNDLDKLEESDDEDEFENSNIDKFVFLDKSYNIECEYSKKFRKWVPLKNI